MAAACGSPADDSSPQPRELGAEGVANESDDVEKRPGEVSNDDLQCPAAAYVGPLLVGSVRDEAGSLVAPSRVTARLEGTDEELECTSGFGSFGCVDAEAGYPGNYDIRVERGAEVFSLTATIQPTPCGFGVLSGLDVDVGPTPPGPECAEDRLPRVATLRTQTGADVEGMFSVELVGELGDAVVVTRTEERSRSGDLKVDVYLSSAARAGVAVRVSADVTDDWCTLGPADIAFGQLELPLPLQTTSDPCLYEVFTPVLSREHLTGCGPSGDQQPLDL